MKASAVTQSFKALASKINNQAPLGPKESNRLLTALTSSFRKHLDEVHPGKSHDDGKRPAVSTASQNTDRHAMHSSAVLADKHMASMLTNPLLVKNAKPTKTIKPEVNAENAAIELKNGANPFDLLESYHAKGCATIEVAVCIMRHFRLSIRKLSYEDQVHRVQAEQAGFRVLSWLWNSEVMYSQAYVDSEPMQDGLVWLLMMEGHEEILWQWLDTDLGLAQPSFTAPKGRPLEGRPIWKSRVLYAMVMTRLGSPHREVRSADAALNIYFRAVHNVHRKNASIHDKMILTNRARLALHKALVRGSLYHYYNTSSFLYDKFSATYTSHEISRSYSATKAAMDAFDRALLSLWHPTHATANPLFDMLSQEPSDDNGLVAVHDFIRFPESSSAMTFNIHLIARAVSLLKTAGEYGRAAMLSDLAQKHFPDHTEQFNSTVGYVHRKGLRSGKLVGSKKAQRQSQQPQQKENLKDFGWLPPCTPAPT